MNQGLKSNIYPIQINSRSLLSANYFANITNLYAHHLNGVSAQDLTAWNGGNNMTVGAGALTTATSPLGQASTYCGFDGSTWLKNTTITVGNNPDFTWAGWVYFADWTAAITEVIASETDGTDGWQLRLENNNIRSYNFTDGAYELQVDNLNLIAGWHHIVYSRSHGNFSRLAIDGSIRGYSNNAAAMTAAGDYELGSRAGGGNIMTGRLWDVALDTANALSANECRKLYAASCQRFCTVDGNGDVRIDGKRPVRIVIEPANVTGLNNTSYAAVSGLRLYIPEDNEYSLGFISSLYAENVANAATVQTAFRWYLNGATYIAPQGLSYITTNADNISDTYTPINFEVPLRKFSANDFIEIFSLNGVNTDVHGWTNNKMWLESKD